MAQFAWLVYRAASTHLDTGRALASASLLVKASVRRCLDKDDGDGIECGFTSIKETLMALSLKDPETDRLARQVANLTGETLTEAVRTSLRERLSQEKLKRGEGPDLAKKLGEIANRCAALPELDNRSADEILGYDENGLPS